MKNLFLFENLKNWFYFCGNKVANYKLITHKKNEKYR